MVHGLPDWGLVGPKQATYGLDDLGELAARLDCPTVWDRRGDVIFQDSFEMGLGKINIVEVGAGAAHHITCQNVWHGDYALELIIGGEELLHQTQIAWVMPQPSISNYGWEVWFSMAQNITYFVVGFILQRAPNFYNAGIRYDHVNKRLEYGDADGTWHLVTDNFDLYEYVKPVHYLKMVANWNTQEYMRVIADDMSYSLRGNYMPTGAWVGANYLEPLIQIIGSWGHTPTITIDNLIFTENEPEEP